MPDPRLPSQPHSVTADRYQMMLLVDRAQHGVNNSSRVVMQLHTSKIELETSRSQNSQLSQLAAVSCRIELKFHGTVFRV